MRNIKTFPPKRLDALTDGVFAIVMTLLVLGLSEPELSDSSIRINLVQRLLEMWPNYISYVVSFLMLSLFWLYHHGVFDNIERIDYRIIWLNLFFLMFLSLIPFTTLLAANHWQEQIPAILYGINMILPFVLINTLSSYARKQHLLIEDFDLAYQKNENRAWFILLLIMLLAIVISFFSPIISLLTFGFLAVFYIVVTLLGRIGLSAKKTES